MRTDISVSMIILDRGYEDVKLLEELTIAFNRYQMKMDDFPMLYVLKQTLYNDNH